MACITVLGAGAFGTAMAMLLCENRHEVMLWCYEQSVVDDIMHNHRNSRFLKDVSLPACLKATADIQTALAFSSEIFAVIPVKFLRGVLMQITSFIRSDHLFVLLSKGIEQDTLLLPTQIFDDVCNQSGSTVVLSGPNFAQEIAARVPSATTIASVNRDKAYAVAKRVASSLFRPFITTDIVGVQVGGALKNIMSLATGLLSGAGYGENTSSFVLTRGYAELVTIAQMLGGEKDTLYGLSGLGDLILTATGSLSRNVRVGAMIGQGKSLDAIARHLPALPEGINTVKSVRQLMDRHKLTLPICAGVYDILFSGLSVSQWVHTLMRGDCHEE